MPIARKLPLLNIKNARNKQIQSALKNLSSNLSTDRSHPYIDVHHHNHRLSNNSLASSPQQPQSGGLSPDLQPPTPPVLSPSTQTLCPSKIGRYILLEQIDRDTCSCIDVHTQKKYVCKAVKGERHQEILSAHFRLDSVEQVNQIKEILVGETKTYLIYEHSFGDLHTHVREKRRLKEAEALVLFRQIMSAVAACHEAGVVLRDLKLRRFVFKDPQKAGLMLETLEDAFLLEKEDEDSLADKHGCPAYVSPEILTPSGSYSGKAADVWSLGVMLYTMLVGRYPFNDSEPASLFTKIKRGNYVIPDSVSSKAKCLIRALLRMDPVERLTAEEALEHPWFKSDCSNYALVECPGGNSSRSRCASERRQSEKNNRVNDQTVPELDSYNLSFNSNTQDSVKNTSDTATVLSSSNNDCPFMFM